MGDLASDYRADAGLDIHMKHENIQTGVHSMKEAKRLPGSGGNDHSQALAERLKVAANDSNMQESGRGVVPGGGADWDAFAEAIVEAIEKIVNDRIDK